jgi:hypothetical protein
MLLVGEKKLGKERRNNRDGGFQRLVESYSAVQYPENPIFSPSMHAMPPSTKTPSLSHRGTELGD